jgi:AcrR family transcriptional regulator
VAGAGDHGIVEEAERVADEVGLQQLTIAALSQRLGVRQPSLYKHIDGMDGLQRSIALRAKNELADTLARAAVGRSCGDAIVSMSQAYRRWAHEHPGRYAATQRAPLAGDSDDEAASLAAAQVVFDVLAGYELHDDEAVDATRALRSALHGFVSLEAGGWLRPPARRRPQLRPARERPSDCAVRLANAGFGDFAVTSSR